MNPLDDRTRAILIERFGLNNSEPRTLESIGREYGITRERVRQIESFALGKIRKSGEFEGIDEVFKEIVSLVNGFGGIVREDDFLTSVAKKSDHQKHVSFLLTVGSDFNKEKEDKDFYHTWSTDLDRAKKVKSVLKNIHKEFTDTTLFFEREILDMVASCLKEILPNSAEDRIVFSILKISKMLNANDLGEWGLSSSPYISPRGMRDYAFLVMRRHGSPMHFSEAASAIQDIFNKRAHVQTVHNELIKDKRFILVGRGLYALKEWGYEGGIVRNVIEKILSDNGALSKDEIVKRVLKERYVKENTILVNLQNKSFFQKDSQGNYTLL